MGQQSVRGKKIEEVKYLQVKNDQLMREFVRRLEEMPGEESRGSRKSTVGGRGI